MATPEGPAGDSIRLDDQTLLRRATKLVRAELPGVSHSAGLDSVRVRARRRLAVRRLVMAMAASGALAGVLLGAAAVSPRSSAAPLSYVVDQVAEPEPGPSTPPAQVVRFSDGSRVRFAAGTAGVVAATSPQGAALQVVRGRLDTDFVPRKDARFTVQAGPFFLESPGGRLQIGWSPDDTVFDVRLIEGRVFARGPLMPSLQALQPGERLLVRIRGPHMRIGRADIQLPPVTQALSKAPDAAAASAVVAGSFDRSHWLQPWRANVTTRPASRMRNALGVVTGSLVDDPTMLVPLRAAGVGRVYIDIAWDLMTFKDPKRLTPSWRDLFDKWMRALRGIGIRPVFLVYGYESAPGPIIHPVVDILQPVPVGARRLRIPPAQVAGLVAGRTGIDGDGGAIPARTLFAEIAPDGLVTLSRPLERALPAGRLVLSQLRFAPFERPFLPDGRANPVFEETVQGWLDYVGAVASAARAGLGPDAFDIELWYKPMSFVSASNYYAPDKDTGPAAYEDEVSTTLVARTARFLAESGFAGVRLFDNFSALGGQAPPADLPGIEAVARHVIVRGKTFAPDKPDLCRPLDATGAPMGTRDSDGLWRDSFVPAYKAVFPEMPLTALSCADRIRFDEGASPLALTSFNLNPYNLGEKLDGFPGSEAASWRFRAKSALRALAAYVGVGARQVSFFRAVLPNVGVVDKAAADGGVVLRALGRWSQSFAGPDDSGSPRQIGLASVVSHNAGVQFEGDGTAAHPPLSNRDVVAFFPFQLDAHTFVAPAYVMTRDLTRPWRAGPTEDPRRFDMPEEIHRLTITGVDGARVQIALTDPLDDAQVSARVVERGANQVVVDVPLTDSVRLLRLSEPAPPHL